MFLVDVLTDVVCIADLSSNMDVEVRTGWLTTTIVLLHTFININSNLTRTVLALPHSLHYGSTVYIVEISFVVVKLPASGT